MWPSIEGVYLGVFSLCKRMPVAPQYLRISFILSKRTPTFSWTYCHPARRLYILARLWLHVTGKVSSEAEMLWKTSEPLKMVRVWKQPSHFPFLSSSFCPESSRCDGWSSSHHLRPQDDLKDGSQVLRITESCSLTMPQSHHTSLSKPLSFWVFVHSFT